MDNIVTTIRCVPEFLAFRINGFLINAKTLTLIQIIFIKEYTLYQISPQVKMVKKLITCGFMIL